MPLAKPGDDVGEYQIETELGRGSCAVVYRARHHTRGTPHALKLLIWNSPSLRRRLQREGAIQSALHHPHVVPVDEILIHDAHCALIMELIDGPSLESWQGAQPLPLPEAERLFRGVLSGLAAAHAQGIVHRDLKPANILLQSQNGQMVPRITDFGIAQAPNLGTRLTRSGAAIGTPGYMAPEQFDDAASVDIRADIYSAGCLLYQLVTGQPPFSGNMAVIELAARDARYTPPQNLIPDLPAPLQRAIHGCLQPDPRQRIPDSQTLLAVLDGAPLPQLPAATAAASTAAPTRTPPGSRPSRRPLLHAVVAAVVLGIGAVLGATCTGGIPAAVGASAQTSAPTPSLHRASP